MKQIPKYNPCIEYIYELKTLLSENVCSSKAIEIKYDRKKFITNITESLCNDKAFFNKNNWCFSEKGNLIISARQDFFAERIKKCPFIKSGFTNDLYFDSILKRMFSQIDFGFFSDREITEKEIDICDNIFKSIYSKSLPIKKKNITEAIEKYNNLQKAGYLSINTIYGIIYSVYDCYNFTQEKL